MAIYDPEGEWEKVACPNAKCSVCGKRPKVYWSEVTEIFFCVECAKRVCPAIYADAIVADLPSMLNVKQQGKALVARFYETLAHALSLKLRRPF